ncbi:hypothetical protein [Streptomyces sp. NPDC006997]|uniref:hypothetical protein n=1 Tax=Streptomyces sp. NPDC006997 TaxID=3155356 RepID=UPI00340F4374
MSDALDKAQQAAAEAAQNTETARLIAAVLAAQQIAQQQAPPHVCQHQAPRGRSAAQWLGIACAVCVGGVGIAFASLALAVLGGTAAIVVLVLRDLWRDMQKKGR